MRQRYDMYEDDYSNEIFYLYFDFEKEIRRIAGTIFNALGEGSV